MWEHVICGAGGRVAEIISTGSGQGRRKQDQGEAEGGGSCKVDVPEIFVM